jgi:hypothetical protein
MFPTAVHKRRTGEDGSTITGPRQKTIMFFISFPQLSLSRAELEFKKKSMGARNRVGIGLSVPARQATQPGGIGYLESILRLLKSLKIRSQLCVYVYFPFQTGAHI